MILPFVPRVICISLAALFLVNLAIGSLVALFIPALLRLASRMRAETACSVLLAARLTPSALAIFTSIWIATSYPRMEATSSAERVGWACLVCSLLGASIWVMSLARGCRSLLRVRTYLKECNAAGVEMRLPGERLPALVVASPAPFFLMAGILRPHLVISQSVIRVLSTPELAVAVRHERAHRVSMDNLKRLLILLSPGPLPLISSFRNLESAWSRLVELAADDRAVAGKPQRSILLARALVRLAREGVSPEPAPAASSFMGNAQNLSVRVDRLLEGPAPHVSPSYRGQLVLAAVFLIALVCIAELPRTLHGLHEVLELLHRAGTSARS